MNNLSFSEYRFYWTPGTNPAQVDFETLRGKSSTLIRMVRRDPTLSGIKWCPDKGAFLCPDGWYGRFVHWIHRNGWELRRGRRVFWP